jgi:hypothetical protein
MKIRKTFPIILFSLIVVMACDQTKSKNTTDSSSKPKSNSPYNLDYLNAPTFAQARGMTKFKSGDIDGAIVEFTFDIDHYNYCTDLSYYGRGNAKLIKKRNWSALYDFTRAIGKNPKIGEYYTARAQAKVNLGFTKFIFSDLSKAKQLGDVNADSLFEKYCRPNL